MIKNNFINDINLLVYIYMCVYVCKLKIVFFIYFRINLKCIVINNLCNK